MAAARLAPEITGDNWRARGGFLCPILAGAALLTNAGAETQEAGRAIREAALEAVAEGHRTADLGGHVGTSEFTDEVIRRTRSKLEVWSAL